jgi:hypothetical protein
MINHTVWRTSCEPPTDEFEKLIAWAPPVGPTERGLWIRFARYIPGQGWAMRGEYTGIIPDSDVSWWMDIPPVPERENMIQKVPVRVKYKDDDGRYRSAIGYDAIELSRVVYLENMGTWQDKPVTCIRFGDGSIVDVLLTIQEIIDRSSAKTCLMYVRKVLSTNSAKE